MIPALTCLRTFKVGFGIMQNPTLNLNLRCVKFYNFDFKEDLLYRVRLVNIVLEVIVQKNPHIKIFASLVL